MNGTLTKGEALAALTSWGFTSHDARFTVEASVHGPWPTLDNAQGDYAYVTRENANAYLLDLMPARRAS